ncbi:dynein regulatory complex protein 1 isoform X2 [Aricia agestis]|nr:dynein regulatory complex protein 1 isoform X2 [Aricia agestis]
MSLVLPKDEFGEDVLAPKEPQIASQDPNERKAARALRIKRRQEALKRAEQPLEDAIKDEEPGLIEQATTAAAQEIQRLALDGAAKVTNVKVTTDEREVLRRVLFTDKMKDSLNKIEEEANDAQIQYEAITANWNTMLSIKDPLEIDAEMKEQKRKCDELLAQKNSLLNDLKSDLKQMDRTYYKDLEIQDNDIKELSDRIEKQITIMQKAYAKQLSLIEQAINIEREAMINLNNKRWEALYKQRDREEVAHMEYKYEKLEEHKQEMEVIMWEHHAKYREAKIELETLIQELQKELEKLKATCLINTEKIGYNYQVLKKREEENVFVRSQQKRKLNKMSDIANALRAKIRKAAEDGALEEIKADTEIVKLMQTMEDIEKKARHFAQVNNYKFLQVWRMSSDRCTELARCVRDAEVCMHEHVLAQAPPPPHAKPPRNPFTKYEMERKIVDFTDQKGANSTYILEEGKDKLVRHILQLVADNTGFLVEDRLLKLIEKYQPTSRNLCTLDSIFMALEIQAQEDVDLLCTVFLNYAFCPRCATIDDSSDMEQSTSGEKFATMHTRISAARSSMSASTSRSAHVGFR